MLKVPTTILRGSIGANYVADHGNSSHALIDGCRCGRVEC